MSSKTHLRVIDALKTQPPPPSDLPVIKIEDGSLPDNVRAIAAALARAPDLFTFGERLVRLHPGAKGAAVVPVEPAHVVELVGLYASLLKFDGRSGADRPADCPRRLADAYIARRHHPEHKQLQGVVEAPTITADGRLLDRPGYDPESGLFVACTPADLPNYPGINPRPDADDAKAAIELLIDALDSWPFVEAGDRSAALAALVGTIVRRSIPAAPMTGITATAAGTGKSLLADWISIIATGSRPAVMSLGRNDDENEKRLAGAYLAGDPVIALDNISFPLGFDLLCQVCTQPRARFRPLGGSALVTVPTNAQLIATGNALTITGDLKRRTLLIRLDAGMERPELRRFDRDALEYARAERGRLIAAALTIPLAYIAAGSPPVDLPPVGSFTEWNLLVRRPLRWLGLPDPLAPAETLREHDPELERSRLLLSAWFDAFNTKPVTATEVIAAALSVGPASGEYQYPSLREALQLICHEKIAAGRLGGWLRSNRGRIVDGLRAVQAGADGHRKIALWSVRADCG